MTKLIAVVVLLLGMILSAGAEAQRYGGGFRPSTPSYRPSYTPRPSYRPNTVPRATSRPITSRPYPPSYSGPGWGAYSALLLWVAVSNNASAKPDTKLLGDIPCRDLIRKVREDGKITKDEGRLLHEWSLVTGKRLDACK